MCKLFLWAFLALAGLAAAPTLAEIPAPAPAHALDPALAASPIRIVAAFWSSGEKILDVRGAVAKRIVGDKLELTVSPADLGADPGGKGKKLTLIYELNGVRKTQAFRENAQVSLAVGAFPSFASIKNLIPQDIRKIAPENWSMQEVSAVNTILDSAVVGSVFTSEVTVKSVDPSPDAHRAGGIVSAGMKSGTLKWELTGDVAPGGEKALDAIHAKDKLVVAGVVRGCRLNGLRGALQLQVMLQNMRLGPDGERQLMDDLAVVAPVAAKVAAPAGPGSLTIISATWGTGKRHRPDVTEIVAGHVDGDHLDMPATSDFLGPAPAGAVLRVVYEMDGQRKVATFRAGARAEIRSPDVKDRDVAALRQEHPAGIVVISAKWGRENNWMDVTEVCQRAVDGDSLTVPVCAATFGDAREEHKKFVIKFENGSGVKTSTVESQGVFQEGTRITAFARVGKGLLPVKGTVAELRKKFPQGLLVLEARWSSQDQVHDVTDLCQSMVGGDSLSVPALPQAFRENSFVGGGLSITYWTGDEVKAESVVRGGLLQIGTKVTSVIRAGKGLVNVEQAVGELRKKYPTGLIVLAATWGNRGQRRDVTDLCQRMVSGDSLTFANTAESFGEGWANDMALDVSYWNGAGVKEASVDLGGTLQIGPKITSFVPLKGGIQSVDQAVAELRKKIPTGLLILDARYGENGRDAKDVRDICQAQVHGETLTLANRPELFYEKGRRDPLKITYYDGAVKEASASIDGTIHIGPGNLGSPEVPGKPGTGHADRGAPAHAPSGVSPVAGRPAPLDGSGLPGGTHFSRRKIAADDALYLVNIDLGDSLLVEHQQLTILGADGLSVVRQLPLPHSYVKFGERKNYFVGIRLDPMVMDLLDKQTGKILKTIKLQYRALRDMVLMPGQSCTLVSVEYATTIPRDRIVVVDEVSGEVTEPKGLAGSFLAMDRAGRHLWVGIKDIYENGANFFVNPDWNIIEVPEYGNIDMLLRFDVVGGELVEKDFIEEAGGNGSGIRVSPDGARVTYLSFTGFPMYTKNVPAWNARDFSKKPVIFETKGRPDARSLAYHPVLPLVAVPGGEGAEFFNRNTGDPEKDRAAFGGAALAGVNVDDLNFSADGMNLILHCSLNQTRWLERVPLRLSESEKAAVIQGVKPIAPTPVAPADRPRPPSTVRNKV